MVVLLLNGESVRLGWGIEEPLEKSGLGHERPGRRKRTASVFVAVAVVVWSRDTERKGEGVDTISGPSLHALCGVGVSLGRAGLTGEIRSLIILHQHLTYQHRLLIPTGLGGLCLRFKMHSSEPTI